MIMKAGFLLAGLLLVLFASCKPTEKNYQAAYDAAKAKREYVDPDQALLTGGHAILSEDASAWVTVGKDSLQLVRTFLKPTDSTGWAEKGPYRLAVAMFKMSTNANSLADDLKSKGGADPVVARDGEDRLFLIVGSGPTTESLGAALESFRKKNPDFPYIGMNPPMPIVIFSR